MSFQLFNTIADAFYNVVGGNIMLPLIFLIFIMMLLFTINTGKYAFLIIIVPVTTIIFTVGTSRFFDGVGWGTQWIPITGWLLLGCAVAGLFWKIM